MKENIIKWCLQLFLSSLLFFLTGKYLPWYAGWGMEESFAPLFFLMPLASTAGVVLGDLSLYKGEELCGKAVVIAIVIALVGGWENQGTPY